ncbi:MAG: flagellar basal body L-ring protein FlgH [Rickettsiales bacterium]
MKRHTIVLLTSVLSLSACANTIDKLARTGQQPPLTKVENPQSRPDYQPLSWPLPDPEASSVRTANSLWQPGSRAFFRDQRAARVGDILRVNVSINDQAQLDNKTNRGRNSTENVAAPIAFGFEKKLPGNPATLADITSDTKTTSDGKIDRKEKITTQIAALVTQVLPNGNLVIEGTQEILVNYEIREVAINGVIRPQDINSDNTIDSTQVAQARITYSGRGQISDVQQPRWGQQVFEAIMPF